MNSPFAQVSLADVHQDVARNIVSLRQSQDLFDDRVGVCPVHSEQSKGYDLTRWRELENVQQRQVFGDLDIQRGARLLRGVLD